MASDDYSPQPIAPSIDYIPEEETLENFLAKDQRVAKSYFHPQWDGIQDLFEEKIDVLRVGCTDSSLSAEEYKIEDLVNKRVAVHLKDILVQVQNAVTATEKRRKEGK